MNEKMREALKQLAEAPDFLGAYFNTDTLRAEFHALQIVPSDADATDERCAPEPPA